MKDIIVCIDVTTSYDRIKDKCWVKNIFYRAAEGIFSPPDGWRSLCGFWRYVQRPFGFSKIECYLIFVNTDMQLCDSNRYLLPLRGSARLCARYLTMSKEHISYHVQAALDTLCTDNISGSIVDYSPGGPNPNRARTQ